MPQPKSEEREFTFVGYDVHRRGVTETARAHLMKDRVRSKKEAKSEWVSRNQFSTLRWMRPKQDNLHADTPNAKSSSSDESDEAVEPPMLHYSAIIDFRRDSVTLSPFRGQPRSQSPRSLAAERSNPRPKSEFVNQALGGNSPNKKHDRPSGDGSRIEMRTFSLDSDSPRSHASFQGLDAGASKQRRTSTDSRSEFGLSLLEGLTTAKTPPRQHPGEHTSGSTQGSQSRSLQILLRSAASALLVLTPVDRNLLRYFAENAVSMLGFADYPELVHKHDPVLKLFLPFATSSQWCFDSMILLFSANHHRRNAPAAESGLLDAENQYLASRQNLILATTRERISALANCKDSGDEDVVAFLFLALAEYCTGNRQIGLMHFQAWREYCEMRRTVGIRPCRSPCKTIVWWCISVMCENDVAVDGVINRETRSKIRDDPGRLFRYFETINDVPDVDVAHPPRPDLADRRMTC